MHVSARRAVKGVASYLRLHCYISLHKMMLKIIVRSRNTSHIRAGAIHQFINASIYHGIVYDETIVSIGT